jgi:hypothetical protein
MKTFSFSHRLLKLTVLSLILSLFAPAISAFAQPYPGNYPGDRSEQRKKRFNRQIPPEKRQKLRKRIQQLKMWKLTERLNLTEEQSARFFPRYNVYQEEMFGNFEKMHSLMVELRELKRSNADEKEIDNTVNKILSTQSQNNDILQKHIKKFRDVLSASQVAELIVFERDFTRDLRGLLRDSKKTNR